MKRMILLFAVVALLAGLLVPGIAMAVTVGKPAPDFTLQSTTGGKIRLSQYLGKKMVLLEFYAVNFGAT